MAGYLVNHNLSNALYFDINGSHNAYQNSFNIYVHQLFPDLPKNLYSYFFYPPTTALIFIPFSFLKVNYALFIWQLLSLASLIIIITVMFKNKMSNNNFLFFILMTFFPLFDTLIQGQVNIILGLIPILVSYYLINKDKPIIGGSALALTLLKPQFLPLSLLVMGYCFFKRKLKVLAGFVFTLIIIILLTNLYFNMNIYLIWVQNFKLFDSAFNQDKFGYPLKLVSSFVALIIEFFKLSPNKLYIYLSAAMLSLYTLIKSISINYKNIDLVFILGAAIIPVISPHLLFYDLSILIIIFVLSYLNDRALLKSISLFIFILFNINGLFLLFIQRSNFLPSFYAQLIYLLVYLFILHKIIDTFAKKNID